MMPIQHILGPVYLIDSPYHGLHGVLGTYLVKGEESMLIDPGPSAQVPSTITFLSELGINTLRYIGLTHIHLDHSGGSWKMLETFPEAEIFAHPKAVEHLIDPSRLTAAARQYFGETFEKYGEVRSVNPMKIVESKDYQTIDLQGTSLKLIWTPGHASHSQSFWEPENRIVIVGDSAGSYNKKTGNIFPLTPPPFNPDRAIESVDKLIALRPEIICYSHFGYTYDALKKLVFYKEQLELWHKVVETGVKDGLDVNDLWVLLMEEDPILRLAAEDDANRKRMAIPNIAGLIDYAKWKLKDKADKAIT